MKNFISTLRSTNSPKEKVKLLTTLLAEDEVLIKAYLTAVYDPYTTYGISAPKINQEPHFSVPADTSLTDEAFFAIITETLGKLQARTATGHAAKDLVDVTMQCLPEYWQELFAYILDHDIQSNMSASTINKASPGLISTFEVMACHSLNEKTAKKMTYPAIFQIKYDAARVAVIVQGGAVTYRTRNGLTYLIENSKLDNAFLELAANIGLGDIVFDGELYQMIDGKPDSRRVSNGVATKFIRGTAATSHHKNVGIALWDIVPYEKFVKGKWDVAYDERFGMLQKAAVDNTAACNIFMADTVTVQSQEEAVTIGAKYIKQGLEGGILKNPNHGWEAKRSFGSLKIKAVLECDLVIVGLEEGSNKYEGMLGAFLCESADGLVKTRVGTGLSDADRTALYTNAVIGKIVTIDYNELIQSKGRDTYSLFLPRFIEIRDDKDVADNLEKIKEGC